MDNAQKKAQPNAQKLGKMIRYYRLNKYYTQSDLAAKIGTSPRQISCWECGQYVPTPSLFEKLIEELKIPGNENIKELKTQYARAWCDRYAFNGRPTAGKS